MTSLCDRCQGKGACCSGFMLNSGSWPSGDWPSGIGRTLTADQVVKALRDNPQPHVDGVSRTLRFHPLYQDDAKRWHFWCDAWKDGRCSIHNQRPNLCRDYPAQHDKLCWHFDEATAYLRLGVVRPEPKGTVIELKRGLPFNKWLERGVGYFFPREPASENKLKADV